jgi:hypothetical protein
VRFKETAQAARDYAAIACAAICVSFAASFVLFLYGCVCIFACVADRIDTAIKRQR